MIKETAQYYFDIDLEISKTNQTVYTNIGSKMVLTYADLKRHGNTLGKDAY